MKNLYLILLSVFLFASCSKDDSAAPVTQANSKLARVDFRPGLNGEKRWLFNADGLLTDIVKADGTPIEKFIYDTQGNLVQNTVYNTNGTVNNTYTITYETGGFIHEINGADYNYSYYSHKYLYVDGFSTLECRLGTNNLLEQSKDTYDDSIDQYVTEYNCHYDSNGNLTGHFFHGTFIGYSEHSFTYDSHPNPIKQGILSILKAKSIYDPWFFIDATSSTNNIITMNYATDDFENEMYSYVYNANDLPVTQTKSHYNSGVLQNTYVTAKYYYQGDVLP